MKTLIEIRNEARELLIQLRLEAEKIHPKLISSLKESDLSDTSLFDNSLVEKYKTLQSEINENNKYIWALAQEYFNNIVKDLKVNEVDIGFYTDGEKVSIPLDFSLYEPSVHVRKIYDAVMEFNRYISFEPFWCHEINMYLKDSNRYVMIGKTYNPVQYIKNALDRIEQSKTLSLTEKLIVAIKTEIQCGYEMNNPKYPNLHNETKDINAYISSVIEHKVLEEVLKKEPGFYQITDVHYKNNCIEIELKEQTNVS